jgi:hypothetical protein
VFIKHIYVADLPSAIKKSTLVQYADDCTLYKEVVVEDADSVKEMQEDLENVAIWCANNGMTLNSRKCKIMDLSSAHAPFIPPYTIGGAPLEYVSTVRFLGLHVSRDLKLIVRRLNLLFYVR